MGQPNLPLLRRRIAVFALTACTVLAADFQSGQAARAVLGQSSFSSSIGGFSPSSMTIARGRLYVADGARQVWTFDLNKLPDARGDFPGRQGTDCPVCIEAPLSITNQSVMPGTARESNWGKTMAVVDVAKRRVLLWRDTNAPREGRGPDVILNAGEPGNPDGPLANPISVAVDGRRLYVGDFGLHQVLIWNDFPVTDDQPADVVIGRPADDDLHSGVSFISSDQVVQPAVLASDGSNLFVGDSLAHRVLVFSPADGALHADATVNSASLVHQAFAPGTLLTINAANLTDCPETAANVAADATLPHVLGGTAVLLDGLPLPLLSVSKEEVQVQLPYGIEKRAAGSLYVRTLHANGEVSSTTPINLDFAAASPGLFAFPGSEPRQGVLLHGSPRTSLPSLPLTAESKAKPGELITAWAAGLGSVATTDEFSLPVAGIPYGGPSSDLANEVTADVNGRPVQVVSARIPEGAVGIYEVQVVLPADLGEDAHVLLTIHQNGLSSNSITMPVQH